MKTANIIFAAILLFAVPAQASAPIGDDVVLPLMQWVESETHVKIPVVPQIVIDHDILMSAVKGDHSGVIIGRPRSGYIPGTVIMDDYCWDAEDFVQMSLLVHELVHHAQLFMKNPNWACADAREAQAYKLQNKWLAQQGQKPFVDQLWIDKIASCNKPL